MARVKRLFGIAYAAAVFFLLLFPAQSVSASVGLRDGITVEVNPHSIDAGEDFDVDIVLKNPADTESDVNVLVEIRMGRQLVHELETTVNLVESQDKTITINSRDFETQDGKIWSKNLMSHQCEERLDIEVSVSEGVDYEYADDEITIRPRKTYYELFYEIDPALSALDRDFTLRVYDQDYEDVNRAYVKFTWIDDDRGIYEGQWDVADTSFEGYTLSDGEVEFKSINQELRNPGFGKYQMDIYKDEYCKITHVFEIRNVLNVTGPTPANPVVGEPFRMHVTTPAGRPATGLLAYLNPGGHRAQVAADGSVTFTMVSDGTYTLAVGGVGTVFDETLKTIKVDKRDQLTPKAAPDPAQLNTQVTIEVTSAQDPISGASVKVIREGDLERKLPGLTTNEGVIKFTPTLPGIYTIVAEKTGFESGTSTMQVYNGFNVGLPNEDSSMPGEQSEITVRDLSGALVQGASVRIDGADIMGITDMSGKFSFIMPEPGKYNVAIDKTGFKKYTGQMTCRGKLQAKISMRGITLGESVKITVVNSRGLLTPADIRISNGQKTINKFAQEHVFTPEKAGDYTVEAVLPNYDSGKGEFKVDPRPLVISYHYDSGQLIINASSNGFAAKGVELSVTAQGRSETVVTDDAGMVSLPDNGIMNHTISSFDPDYEATTIEALNDPGILDGIGKYIFPAIVLLFGILLICIFAIVAVALVKKNASSPKRRQMIRKSGGGLRMKR